MPPTVGCVRMSESRFRPPIPFTLWTMAALVMGVPALSCLVWSESDAPRRLDPAAWGEDHVGRPVPAYTTGDECLFCHRLKIGPTWGANRHARTIRDVEEQSPALDALRQSPGKELAEEIRFVVGGSWRQRFLKPATAYGKLELLSTAWIPPREEQPGRLLSANRPYWDADQFGTSCAGCHATAVTADEQAFSAVSLDCYVCHGNVVPEHATNPELVPLAPRRMAEAREVISICGQCHVRIGKSRSTGRPFPNNFVAGDNLFRDFAVDFSDSAVDSLSTADRHVVENVRDVVLFGKEEVTCLNCHDVHNNSSRKHRRVAKSGLCLNCHHAQGPKRTLKPFSIHSQACGY